MAFLDCNLWREGRGGGEDSKNFAPWKGGRNFEEYISEMLVISESEKLASRKTS